MSTSAAARPPAALSERDRVHQRGLALLLISLKKLLLSLLRRRSTNASKGSTAHTHFVFSSLPPTGLLPPTVLGQVRSPDPDDWSQKEFRFRGKAPR